MEATNPHEVLLEPDVCWLTRGGIEPVQFISRYSGRIRQIHLKDSTQPEDRQCLTELGNGIVNIEGVCRAAGKIGAQWLIYEQDVTEDPFRSAEISLNYIRKLEL
jgi:sugar phosphate isomerase/epimerase